MHQVEIEYKGDLRTEAVHLASKNKIITDAPIDNNGKGLAFSPTDIFASSLGSCILTIMGIVANRRSISIINTRANITKVMQENPRKISEIKVDIYFPKELKKADCKVLEKSAYSCPVHRSISGKVNKIIKFHYHN